jgi:antitoxin MazE
MRARIIRIGNSHGILIPRALIEKTGLGEEVEIQVEGNTLIVQPVARARTGWDAALKKMADAGDDTLLDGEVHIPTSWEETGWEW